MYYYYDTTTGGYVGCGNESTAPTGCEARTTAPVITQHYLQSNIDSLWNAANAYNRAGISESGIGLLAIGAPKGLPKSLAVQAWVKSIWNLYYTRKAALSDTEQITPAELDFSSCGAMPYSVPELMTEIGV